MTGRSLFQRSPILCGVSVLLCLDKEEALAHYRFLRQGNYNIKVIIIVIIIII